ncbi:zinc finger protein OZF-like [Aricia agestis]|uniref:zinc finger protein OZF-like n=1 Tax=Aricia agestis TaxID=91739 RepID=UPI001C20BD8A|nr:zinc finger protein OZF-like [Aricia agestis]
MKINSCVILGEQEDDPRYTITTNEDGATVFSCKICQKVFKKKDFVKQHHKEVHLKKRRLLRTCYLCDVLVPGSKRPAHMEEAHGVPMPKCNACDRKFAYQFRLLRHQRTFHMGERNYECDVCHKKFGDNARLNKHLVLHRPERPFECNVCDKSFKTAKYLRTHMKIHLDDRRYVCKLCGERFVQTSSLKYHMKKRHPEERFSRQQGTLITLLAREALMNYPLLSEQEEDPRYTLTTNEDGATVFSCNICQKVFKKKDFVRQHHKDVHLKKRRLLRSCHLCDVCVPSHKRPAHMEEAHGVPMPKCNICDRKFANQSKLLRHQRTFHMGERDFECDVCHKKFADNDYLNRHMFVHRSERPFECNVCDKSFKTAKYLEIHMRIHLNDRRFVCKLCGESFVQWPSLKYHVTKRHPEQP